LIIFGFEFIIGKAVNATYELDKILDLIVTRLPAVMNLKAATIRLFESSGKLELKAAFGLSQSYLERGPLDKKLATYYIKQGDPVVIPDPKSMCTPFTIKKPNQRG